MKNQAYRMAMLYDFYGDLLTPRQKEFYDLYYNDDLSLAEIAENYDITRQGVRDIIVRAEKTLEDIEEKTGLIQRYRCPVSILIPASFGRHAISLAIVPSAPYSCHIAVISGVASADSGFPTLFLLHTT